MKYGLKYKREVLNVGTAPMFKMHNIRTIPIFEMSFSISIMRSSSFLRSFTLYKHRSPAFKN